MAYLILVRHGESEWNAKGLWTGWTDIPLSPKGRQEALRAAEVIEDIPIDVAFTSPLLRAKETLDIILKTNEVSGTPIFENEALNERNYGVYTGKNKWEIKEQVGDAEFLNIRRSWDHPIQQGESLKQVYERVVPYFQLTILPYLQQNKNVLISAHGNSLRALIKYLENISDEDIPHLELATGEVYLYQIDRDGKVTSKQILATNPNRA